MSVVEEFEAIRRRQEEIKAERDLMLKGTAAPSEQEEKADSDDYLYG